MNPRNYTLYAMDVSHLYTTYDLGGDTTTVTDLRANSGHAIAYYAISPSCWEYPKDYTEIYIGTKWQDGKIVEDYIIDLLAHRARRVTEGKGLHETEVKEWALKEIANVPT